MARARGAFFAALIALSAAHQRYATQESPQQTYSHLECRVDDPLSCSQSKGEVCVFNNGQYRCACPPGVSRLSDGRCKSLNECSQPKFNTCHKDARCIDKVEGYTCECKEGFSDVSSDRVNKPGRQCQRTQNECGAPQTYGVDCHDAASCVDTAEGFQCVCQPGYTDISATYSKNPGRQCVEVVNECRMGTADCSPNAECIDLPQGYDCRCRAGYVDASPNVEFYPGRVCSQPREPEYYGRVSPVNECSDSSTCGPNEECQVDASGRRVCTCQSGAVKDENGRCRVYSQCERSQECDANAQCSNTYSGVECKCQAGYKDVSPDPIGSPGRKCKLLTNECAEQTHDCDPQAECIDTQDSFTCRCPAHLTDVSSRYGKKPGRKCAKSGNYCSDKSQNTCDENADCVSLPDGYTCKCFNGYVDVSSNANLPPGRACTLHTQCPTQPTDLVFLIDGSGSIGSYIFQTDVLRFVSEFTELFDIGTQQTRVSVVQYSDQIRHEFGLGDYSNARSVHDAIQGIEYLTGLTRTGAAIEHVANEAFNERRGARPRSSSVARVAIVITDGRSQDNVTIPSNNARRMGIQLFAVGVTNHVLDSELETIAGSHDAFFHVNGFEDLNTRLRSLIQKVACPPEAPREPTYGPCDPSTHNGCDRSKNQVCLVNNGRFSCGCPKGFELHPVTKVCGGDICNPEISTSCPDPEVCEKTPFGNWRCSCAEGWRDPHTGACKLLPKEQDAGCKSDAECPNGKCVRSYDGSYVCECGDGFQMDPKTDQCIVPGTCSSGSCDPRKKEQCLPGPNGQPICQCQPGYVRDSTTGICLINECLGPNECDPNAICKDTPESYICTCRPDYQDESPDPIRKPGIKCSSDKDECLLNQHNCSVNAVCHNLRIGFLCVCKEGFIDKSPNPTAFGGTTCEPSIDECADPSLNNCHKNATCINTYDSYTCRCNDGFVDLDNLRNPGRQCKKINDICETGRHTCSPNARCVEVGAQEYECICNNGFLDMSPDPAQGGRVCIEQVCLDPTKNDCHPAAICKEVATAEKYTCTCRDGYIDLTPSKPGRECKEEIFECLNPQLNDCDPIATCIEKRDGYDCVCPLESKDISPDPSRPGRKCHANFDECAHPGYNNCSRFADCFNLDEGYRCQCRQEYYDEDKEHPGTQCKLIVDECQVPSLNNCSSHAKCTNTLEGYECDCIAPYIDVMPTDKGRKCEFDECQDPKYNDCAKEATCHNTPDSYYCVCNAGFYDASPDPEKQGRACIEYSIPEPTATAHNDVSLFNCGNQRCRSSLGEVCLDGKCVCKPGQLKDDTKGGICTDAIEIPIKIRVVSKDGETIVYNYDYSQPNTPEYIEISKEFKNGIGSTLKKTEYAPKYLGTDLQIVLPPRIENPDWDRGLLLNGSVKLSPSADKCEVWKALSRQIESQGMVISKLGVDNLDDLDPCGDRIMGLACGAGFCNLALGEICAQNSVCICPKGFKRAHEGEKCVEVDSLNMPLYVIRDHESPISWTTELATPGTSYHKQIVDRFTSGIIEVLHHLQPVGQSVVTVEVKDIEEPSSRNASWETGALFNYTVYVKKGSVDTPRRVYTDMLDYIIRRNNMEIGTKKLFISPDQLDWGGPCYNADCGPNARCIPDGHGGYRCQCAVGFVDLLPSSPGHDCLSEHSPRWCDNATLNTCSPNAHCELAPYKYKCICNDGFKDASEPDQVPGTICLLDPCSDVNYCPANSKCKSYGDNAVCECIPPSVDVRKAGPEKLEENHLEHNYCLPLTSVNECALKLDNCSNLATCIDKPIGYTCQCNSDTTDQFPEQPGRFCALKACGECNGHGTCITSSNSSLTTCLCDEGWTGDHCETAASKAGLILALILALLFLLLTLLCCIWACTRCRCFGGRGASVGTSGQEIVSEYYTIPRPKLKPAYAEDFGDNSGALAAYLDDGASISSGGSLEEIERRVTTDVTTREIRTTTITDSEGNVHTTQEVINHGGDIHSSVETEAEQFAMTSADHFTHAAAGSSGYHASGASHFEDDNLSLDSDAGQHVSDRVNRASQHHEFESGIERRRNEFSSTMNSREEDYATVGELGRGNGDATMDRNTKFSTHHDFQPGADARTGVERRKNEMVTTTTSNETNYF
ncbi:unnamed protein product, partial [Mesorhabditis spiculigera]